jgi:hypothetical protein
VFHVELRQFPHVGRSFNLSAEELESAIVTPWVRGEVVEMGERRWAPERAKLTIYEGPRLRADEIGMGRGWPNAVRGGEEVTDSVLAAAHPSPGARGVEASTLEAFKQEVLKQCAEGRIGVHQVLWLASDRFPGRRVSERLAVAEQAVWELLHQGLIQMLRPIPDRPAEQAEVVAGDEWQDLLLAWTTWANGPGPSVFLETARPA